MDRAMRLKPVAAIIFLSCVFMTQASLAQTPDWRAVLQDLYRYDMAFDACKDVTPSAADFLRLEAAITYVEEKSTLAEDELDELYDTIERAAANTDVFCKESADAVARVRALPESYR
jgi:hypothetical protein